MVSCSWGLGGTELGKDEGWDAGSQMQLLAESRGIQKPFYVHDVYHLRGPPRCFLCKRNVIQCGVWGQNAWKWPRGPALPDMGH